MSIMVKVVKEVPVKYLRANCAVRYWEDGAVNGEPDEDGKIPLRDGDAWRPTIDLTSGVILDWPEGVTASVHYKVCDEGVYSLLDADMSVVVEKDGYVPAMMCPVKNGYGDYVIMEIDGSGKIAGWDVDLSGFEHDDA